MVWRFYTLREQTSTSISSSTSPLLLLTCTVYGIPCHAIIPTRPISQTQRPGHCTCISIAWSSQTHPRHMQLYALPLPASSEWTGSPPSFSHALTAWIIYIIHTAGATSDALPSKRFSFAGCAGPIDGGKGYAGAWWVEKGYSRSLTRNYTRECTM